MSCFGPKALTGPISRLGDGGVNRKVGFEVWVAPCRRRGCVSESAPQMFFICLFFVRQASFLHSFASSDLVPAHSFLFNSFPFFPFPSSPLFLLFLTLKKNGSYLLPRRHRKSYHCWSRRIPR